MLLTAVLLSGSLALGQAGAPPKARLAHAIQAYWNLDHDKAQQELTQLLTDEVDAELAARAHLYLGLIAYNDAHIELARAEFGKALALDSIIELPLNESPKAHAFFGQVRDEVASRPKRQEPAAPTPTAAPAPAAVPAVVWNTPPPQASSGPSALAWIWAVVLTGVGVVFGVLSGSATSSAQQSGIATTAKGDGQTAIQDAVVADVLYGCAVVAGAISLVAFIDGFVSHGDAPSPAPSSAASGFAF